MITKAYVVTQVQDRPNKFIVRIPIFNSEKGTKHSTPDSELSEATLVSLPTSNNVLHPGDCVFVGFENNDLGKPIILGHLFAESINNKPIDLTLRKLVVEESAVAEADLPRNTRIGSVTPDNIACLEGCFLNIRDTFNHSKFHFTDNQSDDPSKFLLGTTWSYIGSFSVGEKSIYVWYREE